MSVSNGSSVAADPAVSGEASNAATAHAATTDSASVAASTIADAPTTADTAPTTTTATDGKASAARDNLATAAKASSAASAQLDKVLLAAPPGTVLIPVGRRDRLIKTIFGFSVYWRCDVNDEVRMTVWILALLALLCVTGFFIANVDLHSINEDALRLKERVIGIVIAGVFALLATVLSIVQIRQHYAHWVHPPSQRCVVRILMMVPVYSISAFLSLVFLKWSLYFDFVRGCYEAFVIYSFMILLTKYLGGHDGVTEWMKHKKSLGWPQPLCCVRPVMHPGSTFLYWLKYGTLQYTIMSPILSVVSVVLEFLPGDQYGNGSINFAKGYVYVAILQNFSQLTSLYCLVWLFVAMRNELAPFNPFYKFLVVKSVVFFTFWQSIALAVLVHVSVLQATDKFDVGAVQVGLQDFIVCIEMFIAAAAHKYTFGYETYANGTMTLLMTQRRAYLDELTLQRAQQEQEQLVKDEERERRHALGIPTSLPRRSRPQRHLNHSLADVVVGVAGDDGDDLDAGSGARRGEDIELDVKGDGGDGDVASGADGGSAEEKKARARAKLRAQVDAQRYAQSLGDHDNEDGVFGDAEVEDEEPAVVVPRRKEEMDLGGMGGGPVVDESAASVAATAASAAISTKTRARAIADALKRTATLRRKPSDGSADAGNGDGDGEGGVDGGAAQGQPGHARRGSTLDKLPQTAFTLVNRTGKQLIKSVIAPVNAVKDFLVDKDDECLVADPVLAGSSALSSSSAASSSSVALASSASAPSAGGARTKEQVLRALQERQARQMQPIAATADEDDDDEEDEDGDEKEKASLAKRPAANV